MQHAFRLVSAKPEAGARMRRIMLSACTDAGGLGAAYCERYAAVLSTG
jgi:hypothetical protein